VLEKCNESRTETRHLFIDFRAEYDSIDRSNLYIAMEEFHCNGTGTVYSFNTWDQRPTIKMISMSAYKNVSYQQIDVSMGLENI
jgi:hypothetical protein